MNRVTLLQIGVGGTGSYLVPPLSKFIKRINDMIVEYTICDFDTVESKNVSRQNFFFDDVGKNKSEVLAKRFNINYYNGKMREELIEYFLNRKNMNIVIGCVDTVSSRIEIIEGIRKLDHKNVYYVDAGNFDSRGQVIVIDFNKSTDQEIDNILNKFKEAKEQDFVASCSEYGDQTIMANMMSATYLYNVVNEILMSESCSINSIFFSRYNVQADIDLKSAIEKKVI